MPTLLDAIAAGTVECSFKWVPIVSGPVRLWVFADALKINGVRVAVTAEEAQLLADLWGALLTTPKIEDLIWMQADVRIEPHPGDVTKKTAVQHSAEIDKDLGGREGLICTVGKSWVLSNQLRVGKAANYAWHGTSAKYPSQTIPGIKVWQPLGTAHNGSHRDYSQTCRLARRACKVDGHDADLRDVLQDTELAHHVSHEGVLKVLRQPGVETPHSRALTEPMAAVDPKRPLRERALAWCLAEAIRWFNLPVPAERVAQYLSGCERQDQLIGGALANQVLKGQGVSFCAAAQGYAEQQVLAPGEQAPLWRAGAREIERDAKAGRRSRWIAASEAQAGELPPPGALCVYWREPKDQGFGHVERVMEATEDGYRSVGANEAGGRWVIDLKRIPYTHPRLLGFAVDEPELVVPSDDPESTPVEFIETPMTEADWRALRLEMDWDTERAARDSFIRDKDEA